MICAVASMRLVLGCVGAVMQCDPACVSPLSSVSTSRLSLSVWLMVWSGVCPVQVDFMSPARAELRGWIHRHAVFLCLFQHLCGALSLCVTMSECASASAALIAALVAALIAAHLRSRSLPFK